MTFFMLRNKANGLWYRRSNDWVDCWVAQGQASAWTSPQGPNAAKARFVRRRQGNPDDVEIVAFSADSLTQGLAKKVYDVATHLWYTLVLTPGGHPGPAGPAGPGEPAWSMTDGYLQGAIHSLQEIAKQVKT